MVVRPAWSLLPFALTLVAACRDRGAPASSPPAPPPPAPGATARPAAAVGPRLVILGFDGVDPQRLERLAREGRVPNVAKLGAAGYRGPLRSTNPPQSPVAWSAFATGLAAGEHGVFDFIGRNAATYLPEIATTRVTHAHVDADVVTPASAENLRRGDAFWDVIARAGVPAEALRVPYNYPPPADGATSFAGLGLPDARGINSSFTLLTSDAERAGAAPPAGGQVTLLTGPAAGPWQAMLEGPTIPVDRKREKTYTPVVVRRDGARLEVRAAGKAHLLAAGETSPYVPIEFSPTPALTVRATTRFTARTVSPSPEVYVEPLSIVPEAPYLPLASPPSFAVDLWKRFGPFKTVGWIDDTSGLGAGAMDDGQFLREALATMRLEGKVLDAALERRSSRLLVSVSVSPDRIGHMFFRYLDPVRPEHAADQSFVRGLDDSYVEMDRVVGEAVTRLAPSDTLVVLSDHGFTSFRRGFNLNTWLARNGFLAFNKGAKKSRELFADVDWSRTRAYALGTGSIWVNVRGREAKGIVDPDDASKVAQAIARKIVETKDGSAGRVVLAAYLGDDLYAGPERSAAPDVRVALAPGWRASWATSLGGAPDGLFDDNDKKWSGDHASARPEDVPGILVTNRPLKVKDPGIEDVAATAYGMMGVKPPAGLVGRALF